MYLSQFFCLPLWIYLIDSHQIVLKVDLQLQIQLISQ